MAGLDFQFAGVGHIKNFKSIFEFCVALASVLASIFGLVWAWFCFWFALALVCFWFALALVLVLCLALALVCVLALALVWF